MLPLPELELIFVIAAVTVCGLSIWLRYYKLKSDVGQVIARQMAPLALGQMALVFLVLSVGFFLPNNSMQSVEWLVLAAMVLLVVPIKIARVILLRPTAEKVILAPDPADKNAGWGWVLLAVVAVLVVVNDFSHNRPNYFWLAYTGVVLAIAPFDLMRWFKPAILTETGYYHPDRIIRWSDIESYQWIGQSATHDLLVYQRKTRWRLASISYLQISAINRPRVDEFLSRYVVTTSASTALA